MGIIRVVEWRSTRPVDQTDALIRSALESLSMDPAGGLGAIAATSKRSIRKNRWAADVMAQILPRTAGSSIRWQVDMLGTKHFELLDEIADQLPDGVLDDRGVAESVDRLGLHRIFGRKEIRHLHNVLGADENVIALGQGQYRQKQGIVVLTTDRLFFFEKSLLTMESIDEFPLASVTSVSVQKSRSGESLLIHGVGNDVEINRMGHGHADAIAGGLRSMRDRPLQQVGDRSGNDPFTQIERLAGLRDKGIISSEDFERKKSELLGLI